MTAFVFSRPLRPRPARQTGLDFAGHRIHGTEIVSLGYADQSLLA